MKLAALAVIIAAFAYCVVAVLGVIGGQRLGLEHTIYLYHKLIDSPAAQ